MQGITRDSMTSTHDLQHMATTEVLDAGLLDEIARRALLEDGVWQDVTTAATVEPDQRGSATVLAKRDGVIAGLPVMAAVFAAVDPTIEFTPLIADGARVGRGEHIATLRGSYASILRGERVALNFLQRLSGTATVAAQAVAGAEGTSARIIDTRKTTPGLRYLERYAVRAGGGRNHRYNLADGILIKDNHLAALRARGMGIADAVRLSRERSPHTLRVELEVTSLAELDEGLAAGADVILLDNMSIEEMREAVRRCAGRAMTEASGGITPQNVAEVAGTGVDLISLGALTHSAPSLDISLELELAE
jgi:nicotinate-nucleotide pyrophosphorylase (carboxylating)